MVGLKPTFGRVPQWPLGAFAPVAVAGPMTRTVRDAALMLSAMARFDLRDPYCLPRRPAGDWREAIEDGVAEMRVAVVRRPGFEAPVDWEGIAAVEQAAQLLTEAGAEVEEADPGLPDTARDVLGASGVWRSPGWSTGFPETRRHMLDAGLLEVAAAMGGMHGDRHDRGGGERVAAAHAMARLPPALRPRAVPHCAHPPRWPMRQRRTRSQALWTQWAPWTFAFNLTPPARDQRAHGLRANGLPRSVQIAAAVYRDDLVLRAPREHGGRAAVLPNAGSPSGALANQTVAIVER